MSSRTWIVLLVIALLSTNAFWIIQTLDAGMSYTYQQASLDTASEKVEAAIVISNLGIIGLSKSEALEKLKALEGDYSIFEKSDGCIYVSEICVYSDEAGLIQGVR